MNEKNLRNEESTSRNSNKLALIILFIMCVGLIIWIFLPFFKSSNNTMKVWEAQVLTKYNDKEIIAYSNVSCDFTFSATIDDGDSTSNGTYSASIVSGTPLRLTIDDLAPNFFSDDAVIRRVGDAVGTYTSKTGDMYRYKNCNIIFQYSEDQITLRSDEDCYFDLTVYASSNEYSYEEDFKKIEIKKGETLVLSLESFDPYFFSKDAKIDSVISYIPTYEKVN